MRFHDRKIFMQTIPNHWSKAALALPRPMKRFLVVAVDVGLCLMSVWLSFYLRLGIFVSLTGQVLWVAVSSIILAIPIFAVSGLYRAIYRYNGLPAMVSVVQAMLLYGVIFSAIYTFWTIDGVPRTIGLIQPTLLMVFVGASRASVRVFLGGGDQIKQNNGSTRRALIYGVCDAGRQFASAIANSPNNCVVGFLDDDLRLHGNLLNGLPIYNSNGIPKLLRRLAVTEVLLALPNVSRQRRNEIINNLKNHKVAVRTLPALGDLATGKIELSDIRDLDIDDLLGREPVKPVAGLLELNTFRKTVLVTGAGGSIGSELCRQIIKNRPKRLLLLDMSEYALYMVHQELQNIVSYNPAGVEEKKIGIGENDISNGTTAEYIVDNIEIVPLLASVCDEMRMTSIMETWRPDIVYHAAAYKHVPIVEQNPVEGLRNNIWGTRVCAETANRFGVRNFVLVSTDKAVRPTNIMGASKRLAEMVLQALANENSIAVGHERPQCSNKTIFSIVRFGNVLGSSGSVVPMFREQIKKGGPITLTHMEICRYFMTIPEAAQLVIQAGAMGDGGDVFVLDMGQPVRILDLARRVIELSGLTVRDDSNPEGDIDIIITGLRPGEKLYEELLIGNNPIPTEHPLIMKANEQYMCWGELEKELNKLVAYMSENDFLAIRVLLRKIVAGYQPSAEIVDWVYTANKRDVHG